MKTAVICNAGAGKRLPAGEVLPQLRRFFPEDVLLTTDPEWGDLEPVPWDSDDNSYTGILEAKVTALVQAGAERFVCIGGDGTATYVSTALYRLGRKLPILGIAAGTANVGPIVSLTLKQLEGRTVSDAREISCDGIAVCGNGELISLSYNDLVIGDTFLATFDGSVCNVSVRALLETGRLVPKSPSRKITAANFTVLKNGVPMPLEGERVEQIVVSSAARESHYGRAVYGPICKCDWREEKGVVALCDHIPVSFEEDCAGISRFSHMQYLLFGPQDRISLGGLTRDAWVVCDGNPSPMPDSLEVRYLPRLARILTL